MAKFVCIKCDKELSLSNYKLRFENGRAVSDQAICCEEHMDRVRDKFEGWGSIKKGPNGTVKRKTRPWE